MTDSELVQYYVDLLILQYKRPNAQTEIEAIASALVVFEIARAVQNGFDIDTAIGAQQDTLGKYLGLDRVIFGTTFDREYWGYSRYGEEEPFDFNPYIRYGADPPDVQIRSYREALQSLFALTDSEYRFVQRLAIARNATSNTTPQIDDALTALLGGQYVFTDRFNMTISYIFQDDATIRRLITIAESQGLLPKPGAVGLTVSFTKDIENIFGYSGYNFAPPEFITGYARYGVEPIGGMAVYG